MCFWCSHNSSYGVRFWMSQRLVDAAYSSLGFALVGTWGVSAFYSLFGAAVGKWTTFRFSNTLLVPDMLDLGNW